MGVTQSQSHVEEVALSRRRRAITALSVRRPSQSPDGAWIRAEPRIKGPEG